MSEVVTSTVAHAWIWGSKAAYKKKKADAYGPSVVKEKLVQFLAKDARTK